MQSGIHWFTLANEYFGSFALSLVVLIELVLIVFIYGWLKFSYKIYQYFSCHSEVLCYRSPALPRNLKNNGFFSIESCIMKKLFVFWPMHLVRCSLPDSSVQRAIFFEKKISSYFYRAMMIRCELFGKKTFRVIRKCRGNSFYAHIVTQLEFSAL